MGKRPKQLFLQRRHTDGQKAHEKMLNSANYQRNANKNYNKMAVIMAIIKKSTNSGEGVEKREPPYTVGGNENWRNHYGEQYGSFL